MRWWWWWRDRSSRRRFHATYLYIHTVVVADRKEEVEAVIPWVRCTVGEGGVRGML
jgi:hypothetical protein